jgi:hypothetical protein
VEFTINTTELRRLGPFPYHIDPWAERGIYFDQLHAHMITYLLDQMVDVLEERGYVIGRERSVQIPDIFIETERHHTPTQFRIYVAQLAMCVIILPMLLFVV